MNSKKIQRRKKSTRETKNRNFNRKIKEGLCSFLNFEKSQFQTKALELEKFKKLASAETFEEWFFQDVSQMCERCFDCDPHSHSLGYYVAFFGHSLFKKEKQNFGIFKTMMAYTRAEYIDPTLEIKNCLLSIRWLNELDDDSVYALEDCYEKALPKRLFKEHVIPNLPYEMKNYIDDRSAYKEAKEFQNAVISARNLRKNIFTILLARKFRKTVFSILPKDIVQLIMAMLLKDPILHDFPVVTWVYKEHLDFWASHIAF